MTAAPGVRSPAVRLILFDIDGTLLTCGPQVRPLFAAALEEVFGTAGDLAACDFSGRTDPSVVDELMRREGVSEARIRRELPRVRRAYVDRLARGLQQDGMRLMPGVRELLAHLSARSELALGLLTGNWRDGARIKLGHFGLEGFFRFGAFGDDAIDRADLLPVALRRAARAMGRSYTPAETLIVGDSVRDVACGRAHGALVLAVATGFTPAEELARAGADWVAPDLPAAGRMLPLFAA